MVLDLDAAGVLDDGELDEADDEDGGDAEPEETDCDGPDDWFRSAD